MNVRTVPIEKANVFCMDCKTLLNFKSLRQNGALTAAGQYIEQHHAETDHHMTFEIWTEYAPVNYAKVS